MWFRQVQLFQLTDKLLFSSSRFTEKLSSFIFSSCLPSMTNSCGWVSPHTDEAEAPLFRAINDRVMLCLQIEEKILPNSVIRQYLNEKIKEIEIQTGRKVRFAEKNSLKDEIIMTLLPRAFSRHHRVYGYIDLRQQYLVIGSTQTKQVAQFVNFFQKSFSIKPAPVSVDGLAARMTVWLKQQDYPVIFSLEKACLLQDPEQTSRTIRCQQQDLSAPGVQAFLQSGCYTKQLRLNWQDQVIFTLVDPFMLQGIQFQDEVIARAREADAESASQQFDADFFIMSELISQLLKELIEMCQQDMHHSNEHEKVMAVA